MRTIEENVYCLNGEKYWDKFVVIFYATTIIYFSFSCDKDRIGFYLIIHYFNGIYNANATL